MEVVLLTAEAVEPPPPLADAPPFAPEAAADASGTATATPAIAPSPSSSASPTTTSKPTTPRETPREPQDEGTAEPALEPPPSATEPEPEEEEERALEIPKRTEDEAEPEDRYLHASELQEEGQADDDAAISSEDRRTDDERRTSVLAQEEGVHAPFSEAGTTGTKASERPEEDGVAEEKTPREAQAAADNKAGVEEAEAEERRDAPDRGSDLTQAGHAAEVAPEAEPAPEDDAVVDAVAPILPEWAEGLPQEPEHGDDLPEIDEPEWWEAGAERPVAPPPTPAIPRTPLVPRETAKTAEVDSVGSREGQAKRSEDRAGTPDAEKVDSPQREQVDEAEGEAPTPDQAVTEIFRQSMGWRQGGAPGSNAAGAPSASEQVASEQEAEASVAEVNTRKTPRGEYTAHVERALMENWYEKDISLEQRALGARGEVTVLFRVRRSGKVADLVLTHSSGDAHIDHLALTSVPPRFARFPAELDDRFLIFEWTFHYRQ